MIRFFDIFLSFSALAILFPFFLILIIILKFTGEGEIFYLQKRIGLQRKKFNLYKFATMNKNSPDHGHGNITVKNDPRILPLGKFLRDTKVNELPQLLNIFIGDMSIIGPRPLVEDGFNSYPIDLSLKMEKIKPGISGLASLILRNEEEVLSKTSSPKDFHSNVLVPYKAEVEIWYDKRKNFKNYLLLILLTLVIVIFPRTKILRFFFKNIPPPPSELNKYL